MGMTRIIAFSGKGGVGKTSLAAVTVKALTEKFPHKKILAIDADPAVGLATALGIEVSLTIDDIRRKVVASVEEAISHIGKHSTGHSDAILTENAASAEQFTRRVDSAAVYVNASTRFTDGGEFGQGCEMGISTQKLHARGPMGLEELTCYKYIVRGSGQIR